MGYIVHAIKHMPNIRDLDHVWVVRHGFSRGDADSEALELSTLIRGVGSK